MSSAVAWRTWEGRKIDGKFLLRQWLGGSDHSAVFFTERQGQPQKAAIKLIAADGSNAEGQLSQWREAAKLSHPHLLRIFDSGTCRLDNTQLLYVVLEFADEDLSQILPQRALSPSEVSEMLPPLLDALGYLHDKGFVHARVKPSNVLAIGNQLKLSSDDIVHSRDGSTVGRRQRDVYDAPETAAGTLSAASDMWSVGATLVATLMQNTSFSGEGSRGNPGLPSTMPEPFRGIARECLHFDPKRRCSIADVMARLQPAARSVPEPVRVSVPPRRRNRGLIGVALLVLALLVGLFIFSHGKGGPPQPAGSSEQSQNPSAPTSKPATAPSTPPKPRAATPAPASPAPSLEAPKPSPAPAPSTPPKAKATTPAPATPAPTLEPPNLSPANRGQAVHQVLPEIPQSARNTITGKIKVSVRVDVDSSGKVINTKLTSPGPSKYFARKALQAAQGWEFQPPQISGQPTASIWVLHFRFGRARTEATPERLNR